MANFQTNLRALPNGKPLNTYLRTLSGEYIVSGQKVVSHEEITFQGQLLDGTRVKMYFDSHGIKQIVYSPYERGILDG